LVEMQNIRHAAAIRPETADISLGRDRGPDRLAPHRDDAVTANPVPSEAAQMQDFVWLAALNGVRLFGRVAFFDRISQALLASLLAIRENPLRLQGVQLVSNAGPAAPEDLCISVALQHAMTR